MPIPEQRNILALGGARPAPIDLGQFGGNPLGDISGLNTTGGIAFPTLGPTLLTPDELNGFFGFGSNGGGQPFNVGGGIGGPNSFLDQRILRMF